MRSSIKPVRKCSKCLLNLEDHCWLYENPREQWRGRKRCPGFENDDVYLDFKEWQKLPTVKTRRELRREFFRKKWKPVTRSGNRSD